MWIPTHFREPQHGPSLLEVAHLILTAQDCRMHPFLPGMSSNVENGMGSVRNGMKPWLRVLCSTQTKTGATSRYAANSGTFFICVVIQTWLWGPWCNNQFLRCSRIVRHRIAAEGTGNNTPAETCCAKPSCSKPRRTSPKMGYDQSVCPAQSPSFRCFPTYCEGHLLKFMNIYSSKAQVSETKLNVLGIASFFPK